MSVLDFRMKSRRHKAPAEHIAVDDAAFNSIPVPPATVMPVVIGVRKTVYDIPAPIICDVTVVDAGSVTVSADAAVWVINLLLNTCAAVYVAAPIDDVARFPPPTSMLL